MNFHIKVDNVEITITRPFSVRPNPAFHFKADNYEIQMDIEQMAAGIKALVEQLLPQDIGENLGHAMSKAMKEAASKSKLDPLFHAPGDKQTVCYICDDLKDGDITLDTAVRLHNEAKQDLPQ